MPALFHYLFQVNIALTLFYLAYRFALRPLTFYTLNRFFLLAGIVFSAVYPFIDLSGLFKQYPEAAIRLLLISPGLQPVRQAATGPADYTRYILLLFWAGIVFMSIRFIIRLLSLYHIHRGSEKSMIGNYTVRLVNETVNPFSFWQNIYLNPILHSGTALQDILQHEEVHVKGRHTLDVLLAELNLVLNWFNPLAWLIVQLIKENLEFITDRQVLINGTDRRAYQYHLVRTSKLLPLSPLVNSFNLSMIRTRILRMNRKSSSRLQLLRYAALLPSIGFLLLVSGVPKNSREKGLLQAGPGKAALMLPGISRPLLIKSPSSNRKKSETAPDAGSTYSKKQGKTGATETSRQVVRAVYQAEARTDSSGIYRKISEFRQKLAENSRETPSRFILFDNENKRDIYVEMKGQLIDSIKIITGSL